MTKTRYGFFAQSLGRLPGYIRTVELFAQNFKTIPIHEPLLYRTHPRERISNDPQAIDILHSHNIDVFETQDTTIKDDLLSCDVVVSVFSHCLYECIELNKTSETPLITPVSLFFDQDIKNYYHGAVGQTETSYHRSGAILPVDDADMILEKLMHAGTDECRQDMWQCAQSQEATYAR